MRFPFAFVRITICAATATVVFAFATRASANARSSAGGVLKLVGDDPSPTRGDVLRAGHGTYIGRVLVDRDSAFNRWPDRVDSPIRVWVEPTGQSGFNDRVRDAFAEWVGAGLPLRFVFVDRAGAAEIHVRWTDHLDRKTGNAVWRVDNRGWLRSSDILLATHLSDGRPLDARSLQAIALHEIGHVIGLAHSDDYHDVMAPLVRVASLSAADRATARLLYTMPAGHLR